MDRFDKVFNTLLSAFVLVAGGGLFFSVARGWIQHIAVACVTLTLVAYTWNDARKRGAK